MTSIKMIINWLSSFFFCIGPQRSNRGTGDGVRQQPFRGRWSPHVEQHHERLILLMDMFLSRIQIEVVPPNNLIDHENKTKLEIMQQ